MYWSIIGTFITVFVGTLISYFTSSKEDTYEAKLLHPMIVKCLNFMPGEPREFKQPPSDSMSTSVATISTDAITVDVQDKTPIGCDNFAYEKEMGIGRGNGELKSQRINNMTMGSIAEGVEQVEMDVQPKKELELSRRLSRETTTTKFNDKFYTPETTGVYKQFEGSSC